MNKNIRLLVESFFDDEIFNNKDDIKSDLEQIGNDILYNSLKYLMDINYYTKVKNIKNMKMNDFNILPDGCIKLNSLGKSERVVRQKFQDIIKNIFYYKKYNGNINLNMFDISYFSDMSYFFNKIVIPAYDNIKIDISQWDVSNVENMSYMFTCSNILKYADISKWNVSHVIDMNHIFQEAYVTCDLSNWKLNSVNNLSYAFSGIKECTFDFSKWKLPNNCDITGIFSNITKTANLDVSFIENFDVSNIKKFQDVFESYSYKPLNLENWDLTNADNISGMFWDTKEKIYNISQWNLNNVTYANGIIHTITTVKKYIPEIKNLKLPTNIILQVPLLIEVFSDSLFKSGTVLNLVDLSNLFSGNKLKEPFRNLKKLKIKIIEEHQGTNIKEKEVN